MITVAELAHIIEPITRRLSRLESREPGAGVLVVPIHAPTHEPGSTDPITILPDHSPTHEPGGTDPLVADAVAAIASLRTLGFGAAQAAPGDLSPTVDQKDALVGTDGSPSAANAYVTDSDPRLANQSPFYNVLDYATIQLAIDAWEATGGTLVFPQGTYTTTTQLELTCVADKSYVVEGFGSTIETTAANAANAWLFDGASTNTLVIKNLIVRRNPANTATDIANGGFLIRPLVSGDVGFVGLHLLNVDISGFGGQAISIYNCRRVLVENCRGASNWIAGLIIVGGSNIVVLGGDYSYNVSDSGGSDYGIAVASSTIYTAADGVLITGVQAHFNGRKGIDAHHAHNIRIIGNTCIGNGAYSGAGAPSSIFAVGSSANFDVRDVVVAYNVVDMDGAIAAAGYGIQVGIITTTGADPGAFVVHGNIIKNCDWNTASGGICINTPPSGTAPRRVVISNNALYNYAGATGNGIHGVTSAVLADQLVISGNTFHTTTAVDKAINAIFSLNSIVTNNLMRFDSTANYGIQTTGGPGLIVNNAIVGTAPTISYQNNVAAGSTAYGNRINGTIQFDPVCGAFENGMRIVRGLTVVTVPIGTRAAETAITFSHTFAAAPYVLATVQNSSIFAAAELPLSVTIRSRTTTGCVVTVYLLANCAAQRAVDVAVLIIGT